MRKRDKLQVNDVLDPVPDFEQRIKRHQARIGHVNMAAHVQHAVRHLPAEHLGGPVDDVFPGQCRLAVGPAGDPLPQGAADIPPGLARGQGGVQVHVRLDVGRRREGTAGINDRPGLRRLTITLPGGQGLAAAPAARRGLDAGQGLAAALGRVSGSCRSCGRDHGDEPSLVHEQVAQRPVRVAREPDAADREIDHRGQLSTCRPCGVSQSAW